MKKSLLFVAGIGLAVLPLVYGFQRTRSGDPIQPVVTVTPLANWETVGSSSDTITASNATLAVGARDYSAVWTDLPDANTIKWDVPNDYVAADLRFQTDANADAHVVEIWVSESATYRDGSTESQFMLGAILTLTGGQQVGPNTNVFVDTIAVTSYVLDGGTVLDSAADRIAIYRVDLQRFKKVVMIATTLEAATTLRADARPSTPSSASGSTVTIQDGGGSITVDSATLATAANQLADGHNVTVDNAAGTAAVEVQMTSPVRNTTITGVDAWQQVVAGTCTVGNVADFSDAYGDSVLYIEIALTEAVAHDGGDLAHVQVSFGDDDWIDYTIVDITAETAATTTINDASADADDTTITLTDSATGDFDEPTRAWFILDGTVANSESVYTIADAANVVTLASGLVRSHANGLNVYDRVDNYAVAIVEGVAAVRVLYYNADADCNVHVRSYLNKMTAR